MEWKLFSSHFLCYRRIQWNNTLIARQLAHCLPVDFILFLMRCLPNSSGDFYYSPKLTVTLCLGSFEQIIISNFANVLTICPSIIRTLSLYILLATCYSQNPDDCNTKICHSVRASRISSLMLPYMFHCRNNRTSVAECANKRYTVLAGHMPLLQVCSILGHFDQRLCLLCQIVGIQIQVHGDHPKMVHSEEWTYCKCFLEQ